MLSIQAPDPDGRILPAVWKLLRLRLRISVNSFRHAKLSRKIGQVILWLMVLGFGYFILFVSRFLLSTLRSPEFAQFITVDLDALLASIPALTLTALFVGTLLTSFGVLLQAMYLSGDMDFLLATPVPIRAVFIAKLLQAVLPNVALITLFGLPLLYGLGLSMGYHFIYYPFVLLTMFVLALAAAGLSSLLVMLVVKVMPPRHAAEILGFIGALLGFTCSQLGNLTNALSESIHISGSRLGSFVLIANTRWLPLNWAGQGLVALGEGQWLPGALLIGATLTLSSLAFWFALLTAENWFYSGWAGMQVIARRKVVRTQRLDVSTSLSHRFGLDRILPKPVFAVVKKDFVMLRRDLRNLSQMVSPIILGVIYTLMMIRSGGEPPPGQGEAPTWFMASFRTVLAYGGVGMSLFVGWMLLSRLAGMAFSQEGKNYWMLKASPVSASHLLTAKFLVAYLPTLALGVLFLSVISLLQKLSLLEFLYGLVAIIMCLGGMAGILLAFGTAGANLTWDDPRKMNAGGLGCLGQILSMLYLPISFGLFILPLGLVQFLELPMVYGYLSGFTIGAGFNVGCIIVPLMLVRKRVERLGEG
ncbi:MAG: hypothetical protein AB1649_20045 [Chloroflexota bacterium]